MQTELAMLLSLGGGFIGLTILFSYRLWEPYMRMLKDIRTEVAKLGGKHIEINLLNKGRDELHYVLEVKFVDASGGEQLWYVHRLRNQLGHFVSDYLWSRSHEMPKQLAHGDVDLAETAVTLPTQSKEQIISEMDAEIKRLREELEQLKESAAS